MLARGGVATLTLEIVEGPGAGQRLVIDRPALIGRSPEADLSLTDIQASRHHAQVAPTSEGGAIIEDLDSANGTFVNQHQLHGSVRLDAGDELVIGVTVIEVRTSQQIAAQPSALRAVPPALAIAPREPHYVNADAIAAELGEPVGSPELDRYRDVRVRRQAELAPLALLILIALALCIYFATR
jgi:pSer/pThr/pTyr-binding forkhead associated (FHA) protein